MSKLNDNINNIANDVANNNGYNDANEMYNDIQDGLNSSNQTRQASYRERTRAVIQQLTPLLFRQYVLELKYDDFYGNFVKPFYYDTILEGNGAQIIQTLPVGPVNTTTPLNINNFVPTAQTPKFNEILNLNFFQNGSTPTNLTFTAQGFCSEVNLTIPETEYLPFFKSGNPEKFFSNLRKQIEETTILVLYDNLVKKITTDFQPQKVINGTATNAFEAWTKEILPNIRQMCLPNLDYNYDANSKVMFSHGLDKIRIIMSTKTWTNIKTNLMSQLYNSPLFRDGVLDDANIEIVGRKLTLGNGTQAITLESTNYIDDNTIIVYHDGELMKWIRQFQGTGEQYFASNFTMFYKHYEVFAADFVPWAKCFKYTNANLNTTPNGVN